MSATINFNLHNDPDAIPIEIKTSGLDILAFRQWIIRYGTGEYCKSPNLDIELLKKRREVWYFTTPETAMLFKMTFG